MSDIYEKFNSIWDSLKGNDFMENQCILATLIDYIAGQDNRKGYEMIEEMLPILKQVGDEMGVAV